MKKKTVLAVFTLISLLFIMFEIQFIVVPVEADSGTIYVNASNIGDPLEDGSPEHPFDKIQEGIDVASSGDTVFVYNGTYAEHVFVNKSLTLIGEDADATIIEGVSEESVIECYNASNVKISGFTIRQRFHGIDLIYCNNITISGNIVTDNDQYGIFLENSRNITLSDNMILNNGDRGVYLRSSSDNTVSNNTVSNHSEYGIYLFSSSNNVVRDNTVSNTSGAYYARGIWLNGASNNIISNNMISKNTHGLYILDSTRNTLRNNNITGNRYNLLIDGRFLSEYIHDIDPSNIVDGKPVYYWVNQHNKQVPSDAGYVALVNSTNTLVKNLNLAKNRQGVLIAYTTNSTVMDMTASYNYIGIHIHESSNNSISGNTITNNGDGIFLYWSYNNSISGNTITNNSRGIVPAQSSNNTVYHNNFISNTKQVEAFISSNVWDDGYPSGGNYWSNYNGTDLNEDGIGDTPYLIPEDNPDNYPLMTPAIVVDQIVIDERCDVGSLQTIAFHAIWAHTRSNVVEGSVYVNSTQHLTNSTGWVSFNATRDTVGKLVWTVTSFGSFYVIWDRVQIVEGGSSRAETTITETETVWFKAIYEYDGSVFDGTMGTLYVNGSAIMWSAVKERWEYNCTFDTPGTRVFKISGVSDGQYGLTKINDLAGAQSITWLAHEEEKEEEAPFWAQWWFWTIIGIVMVIAVVAIYFLRKRKPLTSTHQ